MMNSKQQKQNACIHLFRRKGFTYALILLVFSSLVLSQLKHLLNISNLIEKNPLKNGYMGIANNTTLDNVISLDSSDKSAEEVYIIVGNGVLNVRTTSNKSSPIVATLSTGTVVVTSEAVVLVLQTNSIPFPTRVSISHPVKGWISSVTSNSHLQSVLNFFPSCRPESFHSGVKFSMIKTSPLSDAPRPRPRGGRSGPPPPFGAEMPKPETKLEKFVNVNSISECCITCARTALCAGWTFLSGMCLFREAGVPYKTITGLDSKIVSGSMEFSLREAYSDNVDRGNGDIELQKFILSIDPLHYFRRGKPFTTTLPGTPSSWMEQWPIGNGRIGALAGGLAHEEVIPISISGLHVITGSTGADAVLAAKRDAVLTAEGKMAPNYFPNERNSSSMSSILLDTSAPTSRNTRKRTKGVSPHDHFLESRKALMDGDTGMSQTLLNKAIDDKSYGQTQYAFDMIFIFSTEPVDILSVSKPSRMEEGRLGRLSHLKSILDFTSSGSRPTLHVMHARNFLNTLTGVAMSTFLSRVQTELRVMTREWFVSTADDVVVGHIQCSRHSYTHDFHPRFPNGESIFEGATPSSGGCLNMAFKIDREMNQNGKLLPEKFIRVVHWNHRRNYDTISEPKGVHNRDRSDTIAFSLSHAPTCLEHMHRFVESCGVMVCTGSSSINSEAQWGDNDAGLKAILCNNADDAVIISTTVIGNYPEDVSTCRGQGTPFTNMAHVKSLRNQCWDIIDKAMSTSTPGEGIATTLKRRHIAVQLPVSTASDISFIAKGNAYAGASAVKTEVTNGKDPSRPIVMLDSRCTLLEKEFHDPELLSFQQECVQSASSDMLGYNEYKLLDSVSAKGSENNSHSKSVTYSTHQQHALRTLLTSTYAMSKNMMYASGSRQVSLLQGLWADGAFTAWNGDFHLNINLQMAYWAIPALPKISEAVSPPLREFIQQLAVAGEGTARRLYNCSGWVAHGYVDNLMNTGIRGGLMWNMCVTCGAWLALHLWDQQSHSFDATLLVHVLLPVYRSIAKFFLEYMFLGSDGHMHTGPTASPENSYALYQEKDFRFHKRLIRVVTHSPNIDMAVLRQVSNIYSIALKWAQAEKDRSESVRVYLKTSEYSLDQALSSSLRRVVTQMPNGAIPIISERRKSKKPLSVQQNEESKSIFSKNFSPKSHAINNQNTRESIVNEYVNSPLVSSRRDLSRYPYVSRQDSDRFCFMKKGSPLDLNVSLPEFDVSEEIDRSHRHFSGLLWLFPGTFLPSSLPFSVSNPEKNSHDHIYKAALNLLNAKIVAGGGHTSWSSVWEACLMARLRQAEGLESALQKLLARYFTPTLLSIHPAITEVPPTPQNDNFGCESCYKDFNNIINDGWKASAISQRGMMTSAKGQFQFDGNAGIMAVVHEMLLQSHIPQVIAILPVVTAALKEEGIVRRLRARGGVDVSFMWKDGEVSAAIINIPAWHPAFLTMNEESRGFFDLGGLDSSENFLSLIFPNALSAVKISVRGDDIPSVDNFKNYFSLLPDSHVFHSSFQSLASDMKYALKLPSVSEFPIKLYLCKDVSSGADHTKACVKEFRVLEDRVGGRGGLLSGDVDIGLGQD